MARVSAEARAAGIEINRTSVQTSNGDEQVFGSVLASIAQVLWPENTAAHVASHSRCTVRAAEFYLSGHRKWSGDAIAAIVSEILRRHSMRNVKVTKR